MPGSFYSYHVKFVLVELVESCMLISYIPAAPLSNWLSMKLFDILLCISERDDIIEVTTKKPYSHSAI